MPLLGVQQVPVWQEAGYATSGVKTRTAKVIIVVFIRAFLLINPHMFAHCASCYVCAGLINSCCVLISTCLLINQRMFAHSASCYVCAGGERSLTLDCSSFTVRDLIETVSRE